MQPLPTVVPQRGEQSVLTMKSTGSKRPLHVKGSLIKYTQTHGHSASLPRYLRTSHPRRHTHPQTHRHNGLATHTHADIPFRCPCSLECVGGWDVPGCPFMHNKPDLLILS